MSHIKERVSYVRGLADGLEIKDDANGRLLKAIIETLDTMADTIEENDACIAELDEYIDDIFEELDEIDECLFGDDEESEDFEDDDFVEVECPHCKETVYFDADMVEERDDLICPNCNQAIDE